MKAILLLLCLLLCGCSSTPQPKEDVELNQESVVKKEVELIPNDKYEVLTLVNMSSYFII